MSVQTLILALGLVLIFEGLVFALAPRRIEDMLRMLAALPVEARRMIGLVALVFGALLVTASRLLGGG
jgi:uncharacterized protein